MHKTIVVNLLGGPGCGKSIMAAEIFALLKRAFITTELALEYAKDKVWEESLYTLNNQIYILGKQSHRLFRLKNKVDIIVSDSPLILTSIYDESNSLQLKNLVLEEFNKYNNLNFFILRDDKAYETKGRMQNLEEAKVIDDKILKFIWDNEIPYYGFSCEYKSSVSISKFAMKELNSKE